MFRALVQRLFPRSNLRGPIAQSRNAAGKIGTEERGRLLMINARKERHRAVEVADPDLGGAGVEVEGAFFVDLGWGVRWGKDLDADLGRESECEGSLEQLWPATVEPHEVNGFDTVSGGKRTFGKSTTIGEEGVQQVGDPALAVGVGESWRWTHDDVSVSIGFDSIGEFGQVRIGQDFGPPGNVKRGLSLEIWELDGDGHEVTKSMKVPRKQRVNSPASFDGRYFGPLSRTTIQSVIVSVITWK
jgi:hypothetical protein